MGQNQTKPVQCGAYQQQQPRQSQRDETAIRIRRKLEQGKIKPQQQNFSIQNYQSPQQTQNQMYQQPQMNIQQQQLPFQNNMQQQPSGLTPMSQQNRKNIQIKPPKDLMKQENDKRSSLNRGKSAEGRPPKPKSAKTAPQQQPPQTISQPPQQFAQNIQPQVHPQQPHHLQLQPQMQQQPQQIPNQVRQISNTFFEIDHENVVKLSQHPFGNCIQTEKGFLQHCELSLAQLIESRYNTKMYFPQQNVISLFESIIYAMAAFEAKHIPHHDIYPTNIYFDNNIFKLSNPNTTPMSSYHLTLSRKRFSFLSPQLIICLRQQIQDVKEDLLYRSDMFSFGLVMLQFCSLKPSQECYDQDNYDIIDVVIKRRLAQIKQIYNPKISDGIEMLLKYELGQRMGALQFSRYLNQAVHQYKQDIANAKRSQLNIQGQVQQKPQQGQSTSRVNLIAPKNLPNPNSQQQTQPLVQPQQQPQQQPQPQQIQPPPQQYLPPPQHLPPPQQQIVRQIPRQAPQTLHYEMIQGQQHLITQNQGRPIHSPPPYGYQLPSQQLEQMNSQLQYQYSSQLPQRPKPQSQNNSRVQIMQPQSSQVSYMLQTEVPLPTQYQINVQPPPLPLSSNQNQLPSYPYIQSPISPSAETYAPPAIERTYISSPPPKPIETSTYVYEPQNTNVKFNDFNGYNSSTTSQTPIASGYIIVDTPSTYNSKYQKQTYTFESSKYSPSTPFNKALGQIQYSSQPNYYPSTNNMKPQKDIQFSSNNYREYNTYKQLTPYSNTNRDNYNITSQRDYSTTKDLYKDKDWTSIKNDLNKYNYPSDNKYSTSYNYSSSPSPKFQQQSLQERVRRILQKSKQIK